MEDNRALYSINKLYWSSPMWKAIEETKDIIMSKKLSLLWRSKSSLFVKLNLIFHASITNYHAGLKHHTFIHSQFCGWEVCVSFISSFPLGLTRHLPAWTFVWRLLGRILFQVHSDCWQDGVSGGFRPEVNTSSWLSARGLSQLLKATCISSPIPPSIFKTTKVYKAPLLLHISLTSAASLNTERSLY